MIVPVTVGGAPKKAAERSLGRRVAFLAISAFAGLEAALRELDSAASERNPFFTSALIGPALDHLGATGVILACVFAGPGKDARLDGFVPLTPAQGYARLPVRYVETWMHRHCFFGAPLFRKGEEEAVFAALFAAVDTLPGRPAFLRLRHLAADGPLLAAARRAAAATGRLAYASGGYERAMLQGGYSADAYLERVLRKKKRKEINRLRNRLAEVGGARFEALRARADLDAWRAAFLALEHAGWKGREGTALASSPADAAFFAAALERAFDEGALEFYRLDANGRPIAMIVNFIAGGEGYSFKIAYDETFARFSPGVLMEIDMLKALETYPGLKFVDSCARPDHPMINSLWEGRRVLTGLNVNAGGAASRAILESCRALEAMRARFGQPRPLMNGARP